MMLIWFFVGLNITLASRIKKTEGKTQSVDVRIEIGWRQIARYESMNSEWVGDFYHKFGWHLLVQKGHHQAPSPLTKNRKEKKTSRSNHKSMTFSVFLIIPSQSLFSHHHTKHNHPNLIIFPFFCLSFSLCVIHLFSFIHFHFHSFVSIAHISFASSHPPPSFTHTLHLANLLSNQPANHSWLHFWLSSLHRRLSAWRSLTKKKKTIKREFLNLFRVVFFVVWIFFCFST